MPYSSGVHGLPLVIYMTNGIYGSTMKRTTNIKLTGILMFGLISFGHANTTSSPKINDNLAQTASNKKGSGIAVIFLDLQQSNVTITAQRILGKRDKGIKKSTIKLDLSNRKDHVFVNLPKGLYQITRIDVPHFDLPYKLSTNKAVDWRFKVQDRKSVV